MEYNKVAKEQQNISARNWGAKGTGERTPLTVQHMYGHSGWAAVGGDARVVPGVSPGGVGDQQPAGSRVFVRHQLDAAATSCADLLHLHAVPCTDAKVDAGLVTVSRSFGR